MNSPPDEDDGLKLVRRDEPKRNYRELTFAKYGETQSERESGDPFTFFTFGRTTFAIGAVVAIGFLFWSGHFIRRARQEVGLPEPVNSPAVEQTPSSVAISLDALHVTSISLE